jgi:hypothetical protein
VLGAYGWAFVNPIRRLYYNLTITGVSVVVALAIGGIETLRLDLAPCSGSRFDLEGEITLSWVGVDRDDVPARDPKPKSCPFAALPGGLARTNRSQDEGAHR